MRGHVVAAMLLYATSAAAGSGEQPICADRPGKATATCTVPRGHWQAEIGLADWTLAKDRGERGTALAIGETTLKFGVSESANIEVDVTPWQRASSRADGVHDSASGFGDLDILYKQRLTSTQAAVQVAAMPFVKAPTAKHALGNGKWEGGLLVPIAYGIPRTRLGVALTPEIDWAADGDGRGHHAAMTQVASLGWQVTGRLNLSAELWGQWDWDSGGTTRQSSADGAVAYLLTNDVQLDAGANFGLNRATPDVELYGGVSKRF